MSDNIILIGFMGCGKSSVGRKLSEYLKTTMIDTDKWIEEKQSMTISEIFASKGEAAFRQMETECLKELIETVEGQVISVGGGLPVREENHKLLKQLGKVCYLKVTPEEVYQRLQGDTTRPLLQVEDPLARIRELLGQRGPVYATCADFEIEVSGKNFDEIVKQIVLATEVDNVCEQKPWAFDCVPKHLPERLTISFPIWGLYDTEEGGVYHDFERMMIEHKERGFNCIRLDDGAGLMHDRNGKPRAPVYWGYAFGEYDKKMRQFGATGKPGRCDLKKRLIGLFTAAKKHGLYVILSSWYYLHTYWYVKDEEINDELFAIEPHERFQAFAEFLHYILLELEERGLDSQIAFAEILNEADGLSFIDGYGNRNGCTDEELALFRKEHEQALDWLKKRHPQILFAFDSYTYDSDTRQIPGNLQVYNFHNYFLWNTYDVLEKNAYWLSLPVRTHKDVLEEAQQKYGVPIDWIERVGFYSNLNPGRLDEARDRMVANLEEHEEEYKLEFARKMETIRSMIYEKLPKVPAVSGEGVSYCGAYELVWEDHSKVYWGFIARMMDAYRAAGLWGSVVRTCCGPEDPVWNTYPEKLLEMNQRFLYGCVKEAAAESVGRK